VEVKSVIDESFLTSLFANVEFEKGTRKKFSNRFKTTKKLTCFALELCELSIYKDPRLNCFK